MKCVCGEGVTKRLGVRSPDGERVRRCVGYSCFSVGCNGVMMCDDCQSVGLGSGGDFSVICKNPFQLESYFRGKRKVKREKKISV